MGDQFTTVHQKTNMCLSLTKTQLGISARSRETTLRTFWRSQARSVPSKLRSRGTNGTSMEDSSLAATQSVWTTSRRPRWRKGHVLRIPARTAVSAPTTATSSLASAKLDTTAHGASMNPPFARRSPVSTAANVFQKRTLTPANVHLSTLAPIANTAANTHGKHLMPRILLSTIATTVSVDSDVLLVSSQVSETQQYVSAPLASVDGTRAL